MGPSSIGISADDSTLILSNFPHPRDEVFRRLQLRMLSVCEERVVVAGPVMEKVGMVRGGWKKRWLVCTESEVLVYDEKDAGFDAVLKRWLLREVTSIEQCEHETIPRYVVYA